MFKRFGQSLRIGIARDSITVLRISKWHEPAVTVLFEQKFVALDNHTPDQLRLRLEQSMQGIAANNLPTTIVLADDLVRLWQVTPPLGSTRIADIQAAAAMRFFSLFGETMDDWQMSADWQVRRSFFSAAIPHTILKVLTQLAHEHQLALVEIAPQFVLAWNRWSAKIKPGAWFASINDQVLSVALIEGSNICAVHSILVPTEANHDWLQAHLTRLGLLLNVTVPTQLQICGQFKQSWEQETALLNCSRLVQSSQEIPGYTAGIELALTGASL
ncbi:hypothetical protein [Undibacterium sp. Ren11W]|uniref:hypothetical protein n=1 Tax=Undibacterium sp. Ren11W TaxID=3413045 RepID=UPI003BF00DDC